jgi:hypothetical protein
MSENVVEPAPYTEEMMRARYAFLVEKVRKIEERIKPLRDELKVAADRAEAERVTSMEVAKRLYDARGGADWFALKKEIGRLAKSLNKAGV